MYMYMCMCMYIYIYIYTHITSLQGTNQSTIILVVPSREKCLITSARESL